MKLKSILLLLIFVLLTACGESKKDRLISEANQEENNFPKEIVWGTNKDDVFAKEKSRLLQNTDGLLVYGIITFGSNALLKYSFTPTDSLEMINYSFYKKFNTKEEAVSFYDNIKTLFIKKHGTPTELAAGIPDSTEHMFFLTAWEKDTTVVSYTASINTKGNNSHWNITYTPGDAYKLKK